MSASSSSRVLGYALIAVAATSWGAWPLVLRHAPMAVSIQSAVMMIVLTLVSAPLMLRDRIATRATLLEWLGIAWIGLADAANVLLFFAAYRRTTVAIAVLTHYLTPIFVAAVSPFVLRERLRARTAVAIAVGFFGLTLLLEPWRADLARGHLVGALFGAGSAVFYASNVLMNKRLARAFSGSEVMFFHGLVAIPVLLAFVKPGEWASVSHEAFLMLLVGAVGPGAIGGLLFVWGLRRVVASHASVLTLLEPLVAMLLAVRYFHEPAGVPQVVGGALILVGGALVVTTSSELPDKGGRGRREVPTQSRDDSRSSLVYDSEPP